MELAIKEREIEVREGLDERNKSNKFKYNSELQRAHEMIQQREADIDVLERQVETLKTEKRQAESQIAKFED